ncbi:hypothetical protein [Mucilaginibacter sp.]|jgi:hypothetical protein|uniref:hypothetical protein n=1 Tax=Mucilaginibacter sp. TaxID=1882438 RepID=UPI003568888E
MAKKITKSYTGTNVAPVSIPFNINPGNRIALEVSHPFNDHIAINDSRKDTI